MAVPVETIYAGVTYDLLTDGDLEIISGLLTDAEFLDMLNGTILDALTQTAAVKAAYTQQIQASVGRYTVPDVLLRVDAVFCAGRILLPTTTQGLANKVRDWRNLQPGIPQWFHEDSLPNRMIEIVPAPNYTGAAVQNGSAMGFVVNNQNPADHGNLTIVGPVKPDSVVGDLEGNIPSLPDDFALAYTGFGVLERVFSADSQLKDPQRALYCGAQFKEGLAVLQAIMGELEVEQ